MFHVLFSPVFVSLVLGSPDLESNARLHLTLCRVVVSSDRVPSALASSDLVSLDLVSPDLVPLCLASVNLVTLALTTPHLTL